MKKRALGYFLIFAVSLGGLLYSPTVSEDSHVLETTVLHIFQDILDKHHVKAFDLKVDRVIAVQVAQPKDFFNFYRYEVDLVLRNVGGDLKDATLLVSAEGQDFVQTVNNFSLAAGATTKIKGYEVFFDGEANGGVIKLNVAVADQEEHFEGNNDYQLELFQLPAKLELNLADLIDGLDKDWEVYTKDQVAAKDYSYVEFEYQSEIRSAYVLPNSKHNVFSDDWNKGEPEPGKYLFVKDVDHVTGNFAVSDIVYFHDNNPLKRGEFASAFLEVTGVDHVDGGVEFFTDVDYDSEMGRDIQTVYNLGLVDGESHNYHPDVAMTRAEALKVVMDYFDADFVQVSADADFVDVDSKDPIYPYVYAFYQDSMGADLEEYFSPEAAVTKDFLKFMINAYR